MADRYPYDDPAFMAQVSQMPPAEQQKYRQAYAEDRQGSYSPQSSGGGTSNQVGSAIGQTAGTAASAYGTHLLNSYFGGQAAATAATPVAANAVAASQAAAPGASLATTGAEMATNAAASQAAQTGASQAAQSAGQSASSGWSYGGDAGSALSTLMAAYSAYRGFNDYGKNKQKGDDYAATKAEQAVARTVGDYFTGGLASGLDAGLRSVAPHFMNEVDKFGNKYGAMGIVSRAFGSSKDVDQMNRDMIRKEMKKQNFVDDKWNYTNPDGSTFNIGADGDKMLQNMGVNIDGKSERHPYDVDFSDPRSGQVTAALQGLGAIMAGKQGKRQDDVTGLLVNAAMSGGDPMQNVLEMYKKAGLSHDQAYGLIHEMSQKNKLLDPNFADSVKNGLDQLYGVGAYKGQGSQFGAPPSPAMTSGPAIKAPSGMSAAASPVRDPGMGTGQKPMTQPARVSQVSPVRGSSQPQVVQAPNSPRGILSIAPKAPTVKPASPSRPMTPTSSAAVPTPKSTPSAVIKPVSKPSGGTKELVIPPGMTYEQYMQFMNAQQAPMPTKAAPKGRALGNFGRGGN